MRRLESDAHEPAVPTFTLHQDGRITVDCWPRVVQFDPAVLLRPLFRRQGNELTIVAANGQAVYWLDGTTGYLESSRLTAV